MMAKTINDITAVNPNHGKGINKLDNNIKISCYNKTIYAKIVNF